MPDRPRSERPSAQRRTRVEDTNQYPSSARRTARTSSRPSAPQRTVSPRQSSRPRPSATRQQATARSAATQRQSQGGTTSRRPRPSRSAYASASTQSGSNKLPIIAIAAVVIVLLIVAIVLPRCSSGGKNPAVSSNNASTSASTTPAPTNQAASQEPAKPSVEELVALLPDVIDDDDKLALAQRAQTNDDALWIAQHANEYDFIDSYIQWKMLRLAAYEEKSIDFVRHVMDKYPEDGAQPWSGMVTSGVPHLYQWDIAWANTDYCGLPFGMSGCCPTAFSMVAMALTGSTDCTPYVAGVDAKDNGYAIDYIGSNGSFFTDRAETFGFSCYSTGMDGDGLIDALNSGALVVCNVGPGDFTVGGHFIVATGIADNGEVIVNDPYSTDKSGKTWNADRIANQTQLFYVCTK